MGVGGGWLGWQGGGFEGSRVGMLRSPSAAVQTITAASTPLRAGASAYNCHSFSRLRAHLPPCLLARALEILTRAYGLHDARVAFSLHNLGGFYLARRQLAQAGECYEQALRMKLEVLGTGHRWVGRWWGWGLDEAAA